MNKRLIIIATAVFFAAYANFAFAKDAQNKNPDNAIKAKAGKEFVVTLESNMTTGYQWQLARPVDKEYLTLVGLKYVTKKSKLVGAGGKEEWTFKAVKPGVTPVSFQYVRPWEKEAPPAKAQSFTVTIQ